MNRDAAVAVILAPAGEPAVLLIRRAERAGDRWSGHVALPGGRRDPRDRDLLDTALRETREETGIVLPRRRLVGPLEDVRPRSPRAPEILVRPYVFELERRPAVEPSAEVTSHFWLPLRALDKREVRVPEVAELVPAFLSGDDVVWGLTYRILEQLLHQRNAPRRGLI